MRKLPAAMQTTCCPASIHRGRQERNRRNGTGCKATGAKAKSLQPEPQTAGVLTLTTCVISKIPNAFYLSHIFSLSACSFSLQEIPSVRSTLRLTILAKDTFFIELRGQKNLTYSYSVKYDILRFQRTSGTICCESPAFDLNRVDLSMGAAV